jgi:hypothetical protein
MRKFAWEANLAVPRRRQRSGRPSLRRGGFIRSVQAISRPRQQKAGITRPLQFALRSRSLMFATLSDAIR